MQDMPQQMLAQTSLAEQSARLEFWELNLTPKGGQVYRFHNGVNEKSESVVWQGHPYEPYPVQGENFTFSGKGPAGRPELHVSNLFGLVTGMASDYNGLNGVSLTRRQVYACFLDAVNFSAGNLQADPTQEIVTRWVVEQLSSLTALSATLTLSQPVESDGLQAPGRVMLADVCTWVYRSAECGYTGGPVADEFDRPTTDPAKDKCSHCRRGCELRNNVDSIGCFFSIAKLGR